MESFLASLPSPSNVVFDLDGVVFLGGESIPGAGEALAALAGADVRILFATNNATKTTHQIAERITTATGFEVGAEAVVTSAVAAAGCLTDSDDPVYAVGEAGLGETLRSAGRSVTPDGPAALAVVVGLDRAISYEKLEAASSAVRRGARYIATNTDATFPVPGGAEPGAGALVAAVSTASGREPEVAGKPYPAMVDEINALLAPGATWMVGDRPETDIALARRAGWNAVLVLSGITKDTGSIPEALRPDAAIASIRDLVSGSS